MAGRGVGWHAEYYRPFSYSNHQTVAAEQYLPEQQPLLPIVAFKKESCYYHAACASSFPVVFAQFDKLFPPMSDQILLLGLSHQHVHAGLDKYLHQSQRNKFDNAPAELGTC